MQKIMPLNYLRRASQYLDAKAMQVLRDKGYFEEAKCTEYFIEMAKRAPKFLLPEGGRIFDDRLKGLTSIVRLPYPEVVIEYMATPGKGGDVEVVFGKERTGEAARRIVLAIQQESTIRVYSIVGSRSGFWSLQPWFVDVGACNGEESLAPEIVSGIIKTDKVIPSLSVSLYAIGTMAKRLAGDGWMRNAYYDMADEYMATMELIEALSCANVSHAELSARRSNKSALRNGASPFDAYRILVVNSGGGEKNSVSRGSGNSPREHLRRGHIRRLKKTNIWVQSCVVNAGIGGVISKDYSLRCPA